MSVELRHLSLDHWLYVLVLWLCGLSKIRTTVLSSGDRSRLSKRGYQKRSALPKLYRSNMLILRSVTSTTTGLLLLRSKLFVLTLFCGFWSKTRTLRISTSHWYGQWSCVFPALRRRLLLSRDNLVRKFPWESGKSHLDTLNLQLPVHQYGSSGSSQNHYSGMNTSCSLLFHYIDWQAQHNIRDLHRRFPIRHISWDD